MTNRNARYVEQLAVGYRGYSDKPVAFPFGHGLSYTKFEYTIASAPFSRRSHNHNNTNIIIRIEVKNIGPVAGAEVAQLYLTWPKSAQEPTPALRGFQKTSVLSPGSLEVVEFELGNDEIRVWDLVTNGFVQKPGVYTASVGASSRDIRVVHNFTMPA